MEPDEIKREIKIKDLAIKLGVKFSNQYMAHCFNTANHTNGDRNPSLQFSDDSFYCHGGKCGVRGDHFTLIELIENFSRSDFPKTKNRLMELAGLNCRPSMGRKSIQAKTPPLNPNPVSPKTPTPELYFDTCLKIWRAIEPLPLTKEAESWLMSRGILPHLAHRLGCRDIRPSYKRVKEIVKEQPFFRNTKGQLWYPFLMGHNPVGLLIPSFLPDYRHPVQYRCRIYKPWTNSGRTTKILFQPKAPGLPSIPLGICNPEILRLPPKVTFFTEGEPDYLSVFQIWSYLIKANYKIPPINVIGIGGASTQWQSEFNQHVFNSHKYVICTHDTKEGKELAASITANALKVHGYKNCKENIVRQLFSEERDANDMLLDNQLEPWVLNIFEMLGV